ncbi:class-II fumarase/aspartase family protein [Pleomorphovibrio marinus]|uniref:class-II fumarase/aspartase family protein n=1 Tax=Pleomorphovibrio marinus TaxID=2164132 RepID=UPI000E0A3D84|nr:adenylosuccinate lyase family protein [Pleomorphovibrio marinus]
MPTSLIDSSYFQDMFSDSGMRLIFSDENRLQKWLNTEVALAEAQEEVGIIPKGIAQQIKEVARIENIDQSAMKAEFDRVGFPILPFVHQLTKSCDSETARWVHYGATTQDILDTGTVLQMREGLQWVEDELNSIIVAISIQVKTHRDTVMAGRTFQQLAAPITFGYKASVWLDELMRHKERFQEIRRRILVGQCSGAVGTFATLGNRGLEVQEKMFEILKLDMPDVSWHVARDRWSEMVQYFALLSATFAKIANEVAILMRSEIGELSEPFEQGRGASTTLPQKRNPITCEPIIAVAHKLRELASSQLSAMIQEHERGALGQMHLEWMVIPEAFALISGSLKNSRFILENLVVDDKQMKDNIMLGGGLIMSEAVMMGLAPKIGKENAHNLVYKAAGRAWDSKISLKEAIMGSEEILAMFSEAEIDGLLDPLNYVGVAPMMVDRMLTKYKNIGYE